MDEKSARALEKVPKIKINKTGFTFIAGPKSWARRLESSIKIL